MCILIALSNFKFVNWSEIRVSLHFQLATQFYLESTWKFDFSFIIHIECLFHAERYSGDNFSGGIFRLELEARSEGTNASFHVTTLSRVRPTF